MFIDGFFANWLSVHIPVKSFELAWTPSLASPFLFVASPEDEKDFCSCFRDSSVNLQRLCDNVRSFESS